MLLLEAMIGEFSDIKNDGISTSEPLSQNEGLSQESREIIKTFDAGFARMPKMYGRMNESFGNSFPFDTYMMDIKKGLKRLRGKSGNGDEIVKLDEMPEFKQKSRFDCVGACFLSAFSAITDINITPELYEEILESALRNGQAEQKDEGVQVMPFAFNLFKTLEFAKKFGTEVTVSYRQNLSTVDLSEIAKQTRSYKNPSYKLFVFLPFSSWEDPDGAHLVTLKEIESEPPRSVSKSVLKYRLKEGFTQCGARRQAETMVRNG